MEDILLLFFWPVSEGLVRSYCFVTIKLKMCWDKFTIYCTNVSLYLSTEYLSSLTMCTLYGSREIILDILSTEQVTL